jgi:hypothetical protein
MGGPRRELHQGVAVVAMSLLVGTLLEPSFS